MTTKSTPKKETPRVDETRAAYEVHTLAHMLVPNVRHEVRPKQTKEDAMFWNEPILYGATLPYKEFPQYNIPRYIPQNYGYMPPMYYNYFVPQLPQFQQFQQQVPQFPQFQVPQMGFTPYVKPYELNQPFYGFNKFGYC